MTTRVLAVGFCLLTLAGCGVEADAIGESESAQTAPATYELTLRENTPAGAFTVRLNCTDAAETVVAGSCKYANVTPENPVEGSDAAGWYCKGRAPELTPYGWVDVKITCQAAQ